MTAKLTGVGVGPGDPELLTLKAIRLIQNAPVLAYAVDAHGNSRARKTVEACIPAGQAELPLFFSMSPRRAERLKTRREAAEKILDVLRKGLETVFITEGDPLLYSTFQHLLSAMPPDVPVEVCPGISAMASASAAACFPLAIEGQKVLVAPAREALAELQGWLRQGNSVVLFKAAQSLREIAGEVTRSGLRCETVLAEHISMDTQVITRDMEAWSRRDAPYFSIVLIRPLDGQAGAG